MVQVCEMCSSTVSFAGVYSKMKSLCRSLVILAVLLASAWAQLDSIRIFLNASDLNERFGGTGHVFQCELRSFSAVLLSGALSVCNMSLLVVFCISISADVRVVWDGVLPSSDVLTSAVEDKPLPPLPASQSTFLFTVKTPDVVSYLNCARSFAFPGHKCN